MKDAKTTNENHTVFRSVLECSSSVPSSNSAVRAGEEAKSLVIWYEMDFKKDFIETEADADWVREDAPQYLQKRGLVSWLPDLDFSKPLRAALLIASSHQ